MYTFFVCLMIDTIQQQKSLGLMAVQCLCELLTSHPYFNYSTNIVQLLTVYLDNPDPEVRKTVENCYKRLFKDDKKRLITLTVCIYCMYLFRKMRAKLG